MIHLLLFRHAKATRNASGSDKDRPLEKRGRAAAMRIGAWLREENLLPNLALVSDARRTRETFAYAAKEFGETVQARSEPRIYEASADALLRLVRMTDPAAATLLMIGHNPGMAELASHLTGDGERTALARMRLKFPTAAVALLSFSSGGWASVNWGSARLERFVTPASLGGTVDDD